MAKCRYHEICGRDALEGDELCILHSEDPAKDRGAFHRALDEHREKNGDDFRFLVFPGPVDFMEAVFNGKADFFAVKFTREALFYGAKLKGKTDFKNAEFHERVAFFGAEFSGEADFIQAKFKGEAIFPDAKFDEEANFVGAEFGAGADCCRAEFVKDVYLANARFNNKADFLATDFAKAAYFAGAKFKREADFRDAQFKEANFIGAEFSGGVDFELARFRDGANFTDAVFAHGAHFRHARFSTRTIFSSARENDGIVPASSGYEVDFRDVIVEPSDALAFRDADLSKWRFLGTDLRKVEFTNVKWPVIKRHFWISTLGVYDEEIALLSGGEAQPWAHIERLYRELKQNHEDRRDYERAGDFHYGEKEMRRKHAKDLGTRYWGLRVLLFLYCWVGGYGEKALRPFAWALLLLVGCAAAYGIFGLETPPPNSIAVPVGCSEALRYSLQVMTLLKPNLVPVGEVGKWVHAIESILGPLLIGLFALALRQRLKR